MAEAFGEFAEDHVAAGIFGVEERDAFVASERFDIAGLLLVELRGRAELFDGFAGAVLLLQELAVLHQAIGRLGKGAQETREDGGGFGSVTRFHQAIELRAVILGGKRGFAEAGVDVGERLDRFLIGGNFVEHRLIFDGGFAKLILLEEAARFLEMFVDVGYGHGVRALAIGTGWGSPSNRPLRGFRHGFIRRAGGVSTIHRRMRLLSPGNRWRRCNASSMTGCVGEGLVTGQERTRSESFRSPTPLETATAKRTTARARQAFAICELANWGTGRIAVLPRQRDELRWEDGSRVRACL